MSENTLKQAIQLAVSKSDSVRKNGLAKWLAENDEGVWSPRQRYAAWAILSANHKELGLDMALYPMPPRPDGAAYVPWKPRDFQRKKAVVSGRLIPNPSSNDFLLETGGYNKEFVDAIHANLPEARWNGKHWVVPSNLHSLEAARQIALQFNMSEHPDVAARAANLGRPVIIAKRSSNLPEGTLGGKLLPFQEEIVDYSLDKKRVFVVADLGLGKTICALATLQLANAFPALVVCPASVKYNWGIEAGIWLPNRSNWVLDTNGLLVDQVDILIINYDLLAKYLDRLATLDFKAVIVDESQLVKSADALRTRLTGLLANEAEYRLLLSGTPLINRPEELESQLEILGRMEDLGGKQYYERFFCNASTRVVGGKVKKKRYIKTFALGSLSGREQERRMQALHTALTSSCFIRKTREEVLPQLEKPFVTILPVELSNMAEYKKADRDLLAWLRDHYGPDRAERASKVEALAKIGYMRRLAAKGKLAAVKAWLAEFIMETEEKALVFVEHQEIGKDLSGFLDAPWLFGGTSARERQSIKDKFQDDEDERLVVLSRAGELGLTLTAATKVVFTELYWTPADHDQGIGRAYGRINDPHGVNVYYFVGQETIDADMIALLDRKRRIVETVRDGSVKSKLLSESIEDAILSRYVERAMAGG